MTAVAKPFLGRSGVPHRQYRRAAAILGRAVNDASQAADMVAATDREQVLASSQSYFKASGYQ
jgi:hypothetical protein